MLICINARRVQIFVKIVLKFPHTTIIFLYSRHSCPKLKSGYTDKLFMALLCEDEKYRQNTDR